ncbi:MAG: transposase [Calditrichaeota bacterium]|nr:MAG: transposase [Calditrichota bacterium]MBL1206064.1 transposase [Calditrichota bacterium]NOG45891.1 transposase [Calditrichota bacterium]
MEKDRYFYKNTFHHLYNRGANKLPVFFDRNDYLFFLRRIRVFKQKYEISILCYCLMPNHFHLFVQQLSDEFPIGKFISDLINSYTKSINKKYKRSGVLFQGRTSSKLIDQQEYFIWLTKYILLNPVKSKLVPCAHNWEFSSAKDYFGIRKGNLIDNNEIMSNFSSKEEFRDFIESSEEKYDYSKFK